jgi:hypothetical protein
MINLFQHEMRMEHRLRLIQIETRPFGWCAPRSPAGPWESGIKAPTSQEMVQSALCPEFIPGDENIPIGASKFGGFADLPRIWDDLMPYQGPIPRLICQINLAEIRGKKNISSKLPPKGIIYVLSYSTSIAEMAEAFIRIYTGPCENLAEELVRVAPKGEYVFNETCFLPSRFS